MHSYVFQAKQGPDGVIDLEVAAETKEEAVQKVQDEFLIVQKSRPLVWKYLAIAMFASGLIGATALIIRIAQRN